MHCFFSQKIDLNKKIVTLADEEFKHYRTLRIKENEEVYVTNGMGDFFECIPSIQEKNSVELKILANSPNNNENDYQIILAFGIIQDKTRLEFIFEKGTELGVNLFIPLKTDRTQKVNLNLNRAKSKIISSLKQSQRSRLPEIHKISSLDDIKNEFPDMDKYYGDSNGNVINSGENKSKLFIIGPEGGFTDKEKIFIEDFAKSVTLSKAILRTETACLSILSKYG